MGTDDPHAAGGRFLPCGDAAGTCSAAAVRPVRARRKPRLLHEHAARRCASCHSRPGGHLPLPCGEGDSCPGSQLQATACDTILASRTYTVLIDEQWVFTGRLAWPAQSFTLTRAYAILLRFTAFSFMVVASNTCLCPMLILCPCA